MLFLGFADDVLDIPWRVKLILPAVASLPLVLAYGGGTGVAIPKPLISVGFPAYIELGLLYRVYIVALAVFSANSINILAGAFSQHYLHIGPISSSLEILLAEIIALAQAWYNMVRNILRGISDHTVE